MIRHRHGLAGSREAPAARWAMSIWRSPAMVRGSAIQIHSSSPPLSFFVILNYWSIDWNHDLRLDQRWLVPLHGLVSWEDSQPGC